MAEFNAAGSGDSPRADDDSDSLRSMLDAAVTEYETPAAPEPVVKTDAPADESEAQRTERLRDEAGRFKAADPDAEKAAAEVVDPAADPAKAATDPEAIDPNKPVEPVAGEPPATLSKEDKELYRKLPPDAQKMVANVVKRQDAEFTKKTMAIAALKTEYEPVSKIFEPYRDQMKQAGFTPRTLIEGWANVEQRLMKGEGAEVIKGLVEGYKIDKAQLAAALGIQSGAPAQQRQEQPQPDIYVDPQTGELVQRQPQHVPQDIETIIQQRVTAALAPIQQRLTADDQHKANAARQTRIDNESRMQATLDQFMSAQDDKGSLLHPHFEEVQTQMEVLAHAAIASRQPVPPLKELYETAVWANPSTRAKEIAARETAQREKAATEARAKAAAAKRAGSSVTGAPGSGQSQTSKPELSLREQLEEAAADAA